VSWRAEWPFWLWRRPHICSKAFGVTTCNLPTRLGRIPTLHVCLEDRDRMFLWNVGFRLQYSTVTQPIRRHNLHNHCSRSLKIYTYLFCQTLTLWHVGPLLGNALTNIFPWRWILGNQVVFVDTNDQQTFPWIRMRYIKGVQTWVQINPVWRRGRILLVPRNFSRGRGVIPSLAERGAQSCQRGYCHFGM
jgi:hypothetical protein